MLLILFVRGFPKICSVTWEAAQTMQIFHINYIVAIFMDGSFITLSHLWLEAEHKKKEDEG